jgi:hypothetical protein
MLPSFPPMTPYLPAVRPATHISNPTTKKWTHGECGQPCIPDVSSVVIPAVKNPDLLPISPFLLSPGPITQNDGLSQSPCFAVGGNEGSAADSPVGSLSRAGFEPANLSASRPVSWQYLFWYQFLTFIYIIDAAPFSTRGKRTLLRHRKRQAWYISCRICTAHGLSLPPSPENVNN